MINVKKEILYRMAAIFTSKEEEQGFLLGSSSEPKCIDYCEQIPAYQSGKYFYVPNVTVADEVIRHWEKEKIQFCGFIHSHVVNKKTLSVNDIDYAKMLYEAYDIPVFWFALGVVEKERTEFIFWLVQKNQKGEVEVQKKKSIKISVY